MSIQIATFTATPRPRSESACTLLGAGNGAGSPARPAFRTQGMAQWPHSEGMSVLSRTVADIQVNPNPNRDRAVGAAKPGSPPRGKPR